MKSFNIIPYDDIILFLTKYNISISNDIKRNYVYAYNLINIVQYGPESIKNWIELYNLSQYSEFDNLPDDIIREFINRMDVDTMIKTCRLSPRITSFCNNNLRQIIIDKVKSKYQFDLTNIEFSNLYRMAKLIDNPYYTPLITTTNSSIILKLDGSYYGFGLNSFKKLLLKDRIINVPTLIYNNHNIISISMNYNHVLLLSDKGIVYSYGNNKHGELGLHNITYKHNPTEILNLIDIISVSCGVEYSLVLNKKDKYILLVTMNMDNWDLVILIIDYCLQKYLH